MSFTPVAENHYDIYNARMAAGMEDKLFFADRLEADVIVDYGCADGTLLRHLRDMKPGLALIGFDASDIELAHARRMLPNGSFFSSWGDLLSHLQEHHRGKRIALVASSVIHEIYAYGGNDEGIDFWWRLKTGPFTDFILRDMSISNTDRQICDQALGQALREGPAADLAADYEAHWGPLHERFHAIHFMLKYRYTDNWPHELAELYLPLTVEEIDRRLEDQFVIDYRCVEALPFLQAKAQEELGVRFPCPTHIKLIAHRRHI